MRRSAPSALLVSHWPVVDGIAPQITVSTVQAFEANPKDGRAKALKTALESLMNAPATADPYYWAPFVLVGQNR
ncbi:MAG: CHAT domain-containing protein [Pseudomonadota bacterium]